MVSSIAYLAVKVGQQKASEMQYNNEISNSKQVKLQDLFIRRQWCCPSLAGAFTGRQVHWQAVWGLNVTTWGVVLLAAFTMTCRNTKRDRQTNRQTDRQTGIWTDIETDDVVTWWRESCGKDVRDQWVYDRAASYMTQAEHSQLQGAVSQRHLTDTADWCVGQTSL